MRNSEPLVSIVTPVYNGSRYLAQCIESILGQNYSNWDYTIINNCSTDETVRIAEQYQTKDKRLTIVSNERFVGVIENHNIAVRQISRESKYCKVVSADDWLYPDCLRVMVDLAEKNADTAVIQSYVINKAGVRWTGLPANADVIDGAQTGRLYLLGLIDLGAPTANLYLSKAVRTTDPFFPGSNHAADIAATLRCLETHRLGIVHQILSFERLHDDAVTAAVRKIDSYLLDRIELLLEYGPRFLTDTELEARLDEMLRYYYGVLAAALVNTRNSAYWDYHKQRLAGLGFRLYGVRFGRAVISKVLDLVLNPKQTLEKALKRAGRPA